LIREKKLMFEVFEVRGGAMATNTKPWCLIPQDKPIPYLGHWFKPTLPLDQWTLEWLYSKA
jgi:hypothetical protein